MNSGIVGVEIGGTFTDLVALTSEGLVTVKVPSTPAEPDRGALVALGTAFPDVSAVGMIVHGSTVATNAVLERRGARVGLLVTAGFGDVLELQRQDRADAFVLKHHRTPPLVPRHLVAEVAERTGADGRVLVAPDPDQVAAALDRLVEAGVDAVAVCLLHSYRNPENELAVARLATRRHPGLHVLTSHEISVEPREYERFSTAVIAAFVRPSVEGYLTRFESALSDAGFAGDLHVMQSNGGVLPAALIRRHAVRMLLSGPAGGISAARAVAAQLGVPNVLTFDMGGTSSDISLVEDGRAEIRVDSQVDGLPVRVPMLDILTVGAGGGSIATVDAGGALHVGPQSAGADPGPACYGRGGTEATITDAAVVVGLVRPERFLGGGMTLDTAAAVAACARIGARLGTDAAGGAHAILRLARTNLKGALRLASTERGIDPEQFWLVTYGGAGGQHAVPLADDLGLRGVVVPRAPGLFSAYGLLLADIERDWSTPVLTPLAALTATALPDLATRLRQAAVAELAEGGVVAADVRFHDTVALRYVGQSFDLELPADLDGPVDAAALATRFHAEHERRYGHSSPAAPVEVVSLRVTAVVERRVDDDVPLIDTGDPAPDPVGLDRPYLDGSPVLFIDRSQVTAPLAGPAVIEEGSSTTWVPRGWVAAPAAHGHLLVTRSQA